MLIVSPGSIVDPDSIEMEYEDGYLRRASLSIADIAPNGMIYSNSYSKLYFVEDKERDEVYVSTDGFHYEPIPLNEKDNVTTRAYHWMVAWIDPQENKAGWPQKRAPNTRLFIALRNESVPPDGPWLLHRS